MVSGAEIGGRRVSDAVHAGLASRHRPETSDARTRIAGMIAERSDVNRGFFDAEARRIAALCSRMADRFLGGGRLIAIGTSPAARSDVRHVAVEFVHPVIVGKRALPAIGLSCERTGMTAYVEMFASQQDIVIAFGAVRGDDGAELADAIAAAKRIGCVTMAFDHLGAEYEFISPTDDPFVWQEIVETAYHVLWELVHVYFEHSSGARPSLAGHLHPGASAFLYPFLTRAVVDASSVAEDVTRSIIAKASETSQLRERMCSRDGTQLLERAATLVRDRLDRGGTVLSFGNGGSATDASDLVADLLTPPGISSLTPRRALDLTADSSIITALTNDVGSDVVFARQIIAYNREQDVAIGFSTSGSSRNVIAALAEARSHGLGTIAFTGYDGGLIAAEQLADVVLVAPSEYIPRIQEAHATAYHVIRTLVG